MLELRKSEKSLTEFSEELVSTWDGLCNLSLAIAAVGLGYIINSLPDMYTTPWWLLVVRIFILLTTEFRFRIGHRRYLKSLSAEPAWIGPGQVVAEAIRAREGWEHGLMLLLTVAKMLMSAFLASQSGFMKAFVALMLCNLIWCRFEPRVRQLLPTPDRPLPRFLPRRWMWANLVTAFLICLGSYTLSIPGTDLCLAATIWHLLIAACNCVVDLYETLKASGGPEVTETPVE